MRDIRWLDISRVDRLLLMLAALAIVGAAYWSASLPPLPYSIKGIKRRADQTTCDVEVTRGTSVEQMRKWGREIAGWQERAAREAKSADLQGAPQVIVNFYEGPRDSGPAVASYRFDRLYPLADR